MLGCDYYIPENFEKVNPLIVKNAVPSTSIATGNKEKTEKVEEIVNEIGSSSEEEDFKETELITVTMAELTAVEVLRLVSSTINKNFSGDPLALESFIDSVEILKTIVNANNLQNTLKQCILAKLEGKARECITGQINTVDDIITALRCNIKTEKSQVIEGRMEALKADRVSLQDFSKKSRGASRKL